MYDSKRYACMSGIYMGYRKQKKKREVLSYEEVIYGRSCMHCWDGVSQGIRKRSLLGRTNICVS